MKIKKDTRLLFIGDSITDAGRDYNDLHSLSSFSLMVERHLSAVYPYLNVEVFNRGVSGYRSKSLVAELEDYKALKPDCVIMLIGINDVWRRYDRNDPTDHKVYAANVRKIIGAFKEIGAQMLVLEPFLTKGDPKKYCYYEDLAMKINELRTVCREEGVEYVPLDGMMAQYEIYHPEVSLADDSVHPNAQGSSFIAETILAHLEI